MSAIIETAATRRFANSAMKVPLLSREDESHLATLWQQDRDEKALHKLILAYSRLAVSYASKFKHYGLALDDLIQEGHIGLMEAASRFEPERGVRFSTYASWWIRAAMQDFILRNWSIVRVGTTNSQKSLFFKLRHLQARIEGRQKTTGSGAANHRVAEALNLPVSEVEAADAVLSARDRSLNAPIAGSDIEQQDVFPDDRPSPEDVTRELFDRETRNRWIAEALKGLSERERRIVLAHRLSEETTTLEALGREFGVTKERVRQIEHKALDKLKADLAARMEVVHDYLVDA